MGPAGAQRSHHLRPSLESDPATSWIRRGLGNVVSFDEVGQTEAHIRERIAKLERRVSMLTAVLRLVLVLLRLSGFRLGLGRVADAEEKRRILGAIERARQSMPVTSALRVPGRSAGRYHDWVCSSGCLGQGDSGKRLAETPTAPASGKTEDRVPCWRAQRSVARRCYDHLVTGRHEGLPPRYH